MPRPGPGPLVTSALALLLSLLFVAPALASGRIQGRVVTRDGGPAKPVAGAEVQVEITPAGAAGYLPGAASTAVVTTDDKGRFVVDRMVIEENDGVRTEALPERANLRVRVRADGLPTLRTELLYRGGRQRLTLVLEQPPMLIARVLGQDDRGLEEPLADVRVFLTPMAAGTGEDPLSRMHAVGITDADGVAIFDHVYPKGLDGDPGRIAALVVDRPYLLEVRAPEYYVLRGTAELRAGVQGMELVLVPKSSTRVDDTSGMIREADKLIERGSIRRSN